MWEVLTISDSLFDPEVDLMIRVVAGFAIGAIMLLSTPCIAVPATLLITPQRGLIDEPLRIVVEGLAPSQTFVIRAVMRIDAQNTLASYGGFQADEKGHADIENQHPNSGTYEQGEMGLLWSMKKDAVPEHLKDLDLPFPSSEADPYIIAFELEAEGRVAQTVRIERWFARADIKTIEIHENGLVARLFLPSLKSRVPAVILVGGSEGGLETAEVRGMLLASHGYAALAVAYFRAPSLPDQLALIPVETIKRACDYLSRLSMVDAGRIGIVGGSRGAELALLAASAFPEIRAVVAYSPSNVSWAAIAGGPPQAAWTLLGKPVPFFPNPSADLIAGFKQMNTGLPPRSLQAEILTYSRDVDRAEIPVERINHSAYLRTG
jgi:dienelactone hydrolase